MKNLILASLILSMIIPISLAQSSPPNIPHRVYGEVTSDSDGSAMSGLNVSLRNSSSYIAGTQNTSSSGYYDLYIDNMKDGRSVYLFLDGSNTSEYVNFSRGSSSELNCRFNGSKCVEESGGSDDDDTEDEDTEDNNDNNNDNDGGDNDPSGGGGGGGSGGSGGGGGFAPVPDEDSVEVSSGLEDGNANVSVGDIDEDQFVKLNVEDAEYLDGFSFTAGSDGSVSVQLESSEDLGLEKEDSEIFRYFEVNVSGVDSFRNASLAYTLPDLVLTETEASTGDVLVHLYSGGSWRTIDNSITFEGISSTSFKADSETSDGVYGVEIPSKKQEADNNTESDSEKDLSVQSLTVTPSKEDESAQVNLVAVNNLEETVNDTIELSRNGEIVEKWSISLGPGETRELSYSSEIAGSESYRFSAGSKTTSIGSQKPSEEDGGLPLLLIAVAILLIVAGVLIYIYIIEYRQASELDEVIEDIERKGNQVNNEMGEMRENIQNLRDNVRSSRNRQDNN